MGSAIQEVIARVKPQAEELLKSHEKQRDLMQEIMIKLDDEIAKKNERMIRHHVKALERVPPTRPIASAAWDDCSSNLKSWTSIQN